MTLPEKANIVVIWKRANKKIDTKIQQLDPANRLCIINESFQMKTQLEWVPTLKQFKKKRSDF